MGLDCPGLGKAEEGNPGWCSGVRMFNVLMDGQLHLITVHV